MPYSRPSLSDLIKRTLSDFSSRLTGDPNKILRKSAAGIMSRVLAGGMHLIYGYIDWVAKQIIIDTAEAEWLERWAAIWGIKRKAAQPATGIIDITGTDTTNIPQGSVLNRSDGAKFETEMAVVIAGGVASVEVTSIAASEETGFGSDGNTDPGTTLSFETPINGVDSVAVDASGLTGGIDEEKDEQLKSRLLFRIQEPPRAGSANDYIRWALEVPGVTRAWAYALHMGPGTVGLTFVQDGEVDIIPDQAKLDEVEAYVLQFRPITAELFVFAPLEQIIDLTMFLDPNTAAVQQAIDAEVDDFYSREFSPGDPLVLSNLNEAISLAEGEDAHTITATTPAAVNGIITLGATVLPKRGVHTYNPFP